MKIGDKVVCVDNKGDSFGWRQVPKQGVVYVIREVFTSVLSPGVGVLLIGLHNDFHPITGQELGFHAWRFRLLDELKAENRERIGKGDSVPNAVPALTSASFISKAFLVPAL